MIGEGFRNPTERVEKLRAQILNVIPHVETERALLITESYKETEEKPIILRRALALKNILENLPIVIREDELIVGSLTKEPRSSQVFPEFSNKWLKEELNRLDKRKGDVFIITEEDKEKLNEVFEYWDGKTTNELATSYMDEETISAMNANVFTVGNYYFNGVGHISVNYGKVIKEGYNKIIKEAMDQLENNDDKDPEYIKKKQFLESVIISCRAAIEFANRYANKADELAEKMKDINRKKELKEISRICRKVPKEGSTSFYEACQAFWFVHAIINIESNGHSISPTRFDQYMYPYYKKDINEGNITKEFAQELIDCVWIKLNDINKVRDEISTKYFGGYPMYQNLIVGGQNKGGQDVTNELSYMALAASAHVRLPQPSLSVRIWNKTPDEFLLKACELTREGLGLPAYYNDEVIIPALVARGVTLEDARRYGIIGCVEPQCPGKTEGWHDSAFFNLARIVELAISSGKDNGKQVGPKTELFIKMKSFDDFIRAYKIQMDYFVKHMCIADNCVDISHAERAPLPFLSSMVEDCIGKGKSLQEGGAQYNFSGPQGVGVANVGDSLMAIKKLVFEENKITKKELKEALDSNFSNNPRIKQMLIKQSPKYGNDIDEVDELAREGALIYCKEVNKYMNPRGGHFQPGLYPSSINVYFGSLTGATPDGRSSNEPLADGVSPSRGQDTCGPTAAGNSVAKLDHFIASNGTLFNQKFHPSALKGDKGLQNLAAVVRSYFDQKGMHVQYNVIDRDTLIKAQENPEDYRDLIVRVAGYSAQFISLNKAIQDDIIKRTEHVM
ncbi:glycyl radical glycerol dehydratase DhaB1 [Clostridium botulinum]|uniref:glycyl radical glycerol dehydratase DhaB1 n=1 Tax=Clostridium botulinum TaxID=1491 RepID=UPI0004D53CBB|nr:glycyl radical protein [Clostridium botulinum]KEI03599.1 pyruvate formate-lyase [Clostridium botulinum D str. 16868]